MAAGPREASDPGGVADVFRVEDPEIDVASMVARIREQLATRPGLSADPGPILRFFEGPSGPLDDVGRAVDWLGMQLEIPVPSDRMVPARDRIGRALDRVRQPFHRLVRYYVDAQAQRQDELLRQVHAALRAVVVRFHAEGTRYETLADDVAALRETVEALRAEVAELRSRPPTGA